MKKYLKSIAVAALVALVSLSANAQSDAVDRIAQLDDVYSFYLPYAMVSKLGNLGNLDILKATPIPSGMLKNVKSMQFIVAGKKKVVKKAQKILKDIEKDRRYSVLFNSSKNKDEKITIYAYPAHSTVFSEVVLVINEHDRQLIVAQLIGEISMDDINDIEDELKDDKVEEVDSGNTTVTIIED